MPDTESGPGKHRERKRTAPNPALQAKIREGLGLRPDQSVSFAQLRLRDPLNVRKDIRLDEVTPLPADEADPVIVGRGYAVSGSIRVSRAGEVTLSTLANMTRGVVNISFGNVSTREAGGFRAFRNLVAGVVVRISGRTEDGYVGKVANELGHLPRIQELPEPPPPTAPRRRGGS